MIHSGPLFVTLWYLLIIYIIDMHMHIILKDAVKCGVCRDIQVDPCTLACGYAFCLLCLARLWKDNEKFCPVCKVTWEVFPAISYDFR